MRKVIGLACAAVLAASGLANAQQAVETTKIKQTPTGTKEVRKISQIIGSNVQLQGGSNYGKVNDVIVGDNGLDYLVVERQGRYALFPWSGANVNYGKRVVNYDVAPNAVQPLFFAQDAWPNLAEPAYANQVGTIFNTGGAVPAPAPGVVKEKIKVNERTGNVKVKEKVR
jgi:hypothetical protein